MSYADDLRGWADRIGEWTSPGKDVYVNNDISGHAVWNALTLRPPVG